MDSLNDLIKAACSFLDNGFDVQTFTSWKGLAVVTLVALLGPFHYYTQNFKRFTRVTNRRSLLAGTGVLVAAKEQIVSGTGDTAGLSESETAS
jgi:hypothetical protein